MSLYTLCWCYRERFQLWRGCDGTYVGNLIQCLCSTSTVVLSWNITTSNWFIVCDFHVGSDNCIYNKCTGDESESFQVSYNNMTYSSIVSFSVNKSRDVYKLCALMEQDLINEVALSKFQV